MQYKKSCRIDKNSILLRIALRTPLDDRLGARTQLLVNPKIHHPENDRMEENTHSEQVDLSSPSYNQDASDVSPENDTEYPPTKWSPDRQIMSLEAAVGEIKSAHDTYLGLRGRATRRFFFMIGAGVSYPPIPLASNIINKCRDLIGKENSQRLETLDRQVLRRPPIEQYEAYLRSAFPSPFQRAEYFQSLILDAKLSHASLRLAHLLTAKPNSLISELVVTTNFDELLFKCLRLFGKEPQVFSHPGEFYRIPLDEDEPLIVHLHGRVHNYDVANLIFEQERSAKNSALQSFLDHVLAERSPIVIGYSGWENDAFMWNLKTRLTSDCSLKANIYWFCYSREGYQQLPKWLRFSKEAFFVLAPQVQDITTTLTSRLEPAFGAPGFQYDTADSSTLPATQVFEALIRTFAIPSPPFTNNTLSFISGALKRILPDEPTPGNDTIRFEAKNYFLNRISRMIDIAAENTQGDVSLSAILENVRQCHFADALDSAFQMWNSIADKREAAEKMPYDLYDLQDAMWTATVGLAFDESGMDTERELRGHDTVCEICMLLLQNGQERFKEELTYLEHRLARSLLYKGIKLAQRTPPQWGEAYKNFLGAVQHLNIASKTNPTFGLMLWRAANMTYIAYHDAGVFQCDGAAKDLAIDHLLDEVSGVLNEARNHVEESADLEYAYLQGAFNKACLEWKSNRGVYTRTLEEMKVVSHPKKRESVLLLEKVRRWLRQPNSVGSDPGNKS